MTEVLRPYPVMKESSVAWLGEVPFAWRIQRIKTLFREKDERSGDGSGMLLSLTRSRGLLPQSEASDRIASASDLSKYKICHPADLVMNRMQAWHGMFAASKYNGLVSPDYAVFAAHAGTNVEFFEELFKTPALVEQFAQASRGIGSGFNRLYTDDFGAIAVPVPPPAEQAAIVRFLDHADRKIGRAIRAKLKLVKLLEEEKQAIIHRAVTRGLDPNVRLKTSGVEWLGEVPEHWEIGQVRSIARVVRGGSPRPAGSPLYFHGQSMPWITVGEVTHASGSYVTTTATRLTPAGVERSRVIEQGTLLLTNSGATLGIPKIAAIQGCINDGVAAFLGLHARVQKEFLLHYFTSQTSHLKAWVDLGAQPNLNTQIIGGWPVPIPPIEEQCTIVAHITRCTRRLDDATMCVAVEVSKLREYRTRLIADVVTGKLDVREAAARLPEEGESDVLDTDEQSPDVEDDNEGESEAEAEAEDAEALP